MEYATLAGHARHVLGTLKIGRNLKFMEAHIARSWERCANDFHLAPDNPQTAIILEAGELKQRQQRFGELLTTARAEMEALYEQISGSGYAVLLSDPDGTIVSAINDPALKKDFRDVGLCLGAVWDERHQGTNGIGTCVSERRPVTVHRTEHYLGHNISLSCSGAPILSPGGEVLAVLDASSANSSDTKLIQRHTMALVNMSANLISKCHFLSEFPRAWVLRFHSRPEFVGLLQEALVAVDGSGHIVAVNQSAVDQLGVSDRRALVGLPIGQVFQFDFDVLERRGATAPNTLWPIRDAEHGRRFFAMVRAPIAEVRHVAATAAGSAEPLDARDELVAAGVGADAQMRRNLASARQLIEKKVSILLQGATGTGKEAFAKTLHKLSSRADKPFVAVNCAAIPESLIESELFGYTKGAFTDASREGRRGKIQQAHGGTLFLDEIGDMPPQLQTRLLRVLEEKEVVPLGGEQAIPVDVHVISATHRDVRQMIEAGEFREDLYYRLNGVTLQLPLLRDRTDKRELIHLLLESESRTDCKIRISADALDKLCAFSWPGNIRQLRNVLRTAAALCVDSLIRPSNLPQEVIDPTPRSVLREPQPLPVQNTAMPVAEGSPLRSAERVTLLRELERLRWNVTRTAESLGVSRNTLYRKLHKHGIPVAM